MQFHDQGTRDIYIVLRQHAAASHPSETTGLHELVLNIAGGHNLTCSYCFASQGMYANTKSSWMSPTTARSVTRSMLQEHPTLNRVKFFGGEPFMNLGAIEETFNVLDEFESQPHGHQITRVCVTNMTIFSPRVVKLAQRGLHITFSIDGPPEIHDINRRFTNGRGSFSKIVDVLRRYRDAGVEPLAVESVYTPRHLDFGMTLSELDDYLRTTFDVDETIIVPYFEKPTALPSSSRWSEKDFAGAVRIGARQREINQGRPAKSGVTGRNRRRDALRQITAPTPSSGWCGLGRQTLTVAQDGSLLPCYTLLQKPESWTLRKDARAPETAPPSTPDVLGRLDAANPRVFSECAGCDIRDVCRGCPGGQFAVSGTFSGKSLTSCSYQIGLIEGLISAYLPLQKAAA